VDWSIFHFLNDALRGHALIQDELEDFVTGWAVPLFAGLTALLWLLDRPGSMPRWRLASLSGLAAAGLGLLVAQPIALLVDRPRPFEAHPADTLLLVPPSHEPSFPSDHAVAAFAIAFAVAFFGRRVGAFFLAAATVVAFTRVLVGLHYPGDIAAGALIGLASAAAVVPLVRRYGAWTVLHLSRVTDPVAAVAWHAVTSLQARLPRRR
jgi:membrane-associated phospholipid phosphatase